MMRFKCMTTLLVLRGYFFIQGKKTRFFLASILFCWQLRIQLILLWGLDQFLL